MKDFTREELLCSKEYWVADIQLKLFQEVEAYMERHQMNRTQLAEHLKCSKGYVSQLLSGDYDNKLSKLVELSLAIGKVPSIDFIDTNEFIQFESKKYTGLDTFSFGQLVLAPVNSNPCTDDNLIKTAA